MKRILFASMILLVITITLFFIKRDFGFCGIILLSGFLAIFCYSVTFSLNKILFINDLENNLEIHGRLKFREVLKGYDLIEVSELSNFKQVNNYFESDIRVHDSEEYLQDMNKSLLFATIIYIIGTLFYIISFFEKDKLPGEVAETATSKIHYAYIYLASIAGYTFWYISPLMIFKKKNSKACKTKHHISVESPASDKKSDTPK